MNKLKKASDFTGSGISLGLSLGMCFGISLGMLLFDNMALGIGVGMCFGVAFGSMKDNAKRKELEKTGYKIIEILTLDDGGFSLTSEKESGEIRTFVITPEEMEQNKFAVGDYVYEDGEDE